MQAPWQAVLDFWFYPADHPGYLTYRTAWFEKNPDFDAQIQQRFETLVHEALAGELQEWGHAVHGELARILLLDQFPRNIWRDTSKAFIGDALALQYAFAMLDGGRDTQLPPIQRQFVYLPLMHAEDLKVQERCVALYEQLAQIDPAQEGGLNYARQHRDIIQTFGRFPHRNRQLGRSSTPAEVAFLKTPNSSF